MADDGYEVYYAEKLWELIPGVLRHEDGLGTNPGVLRALIEIWAREAAKLRRGADQLWDNGQIELAEDWAVPYLGQLVGARHLDVLGPRASRIAVKKAIHYRRRSGTRHLIEALIADIAGHEGIVTEGFARLARAPHRLDPPIAPVPPGADPLNPTPMGGMADLRSPMRLALAGGPFDAFAWRPDLRRPAAALIPGSAMSVVDAPLATAGIRKIGLHLYRRRVYALEGVVPARRAPGLFTFDPSGRDIALYQVSDRGAGGVQGLAGTGFSDWHAADPWEVPGPMLCRVLGHAIYILSEAALATLAPTMSAARIDQLRRLRGHRLEGPGALRRALMFLPDAAYFTGTTVFGRIRAAALRAECGKAGLIPGSLRITEAGAVLPPERVTAAHLGATAPSASGYRAAVDPEQGRLRFLGAAPVTPRVDYAAALAGPVGAGPWPRPAAAARVATRSVSGGAPITAADFAPQGVMEVTDSATYAIGPAQATVHASIWQSREGQRPYLTRGADFTFIAGTPEAELTLDGLWFGVAMGHGAPIAIRLRGSYRRVSLTHCTLDPGGARGPEPGAPTLPAVQLIVAGEVDRLEIADSIMGPISTTGTGQINRLSIRDSILQAPAPGAAITQPAGETILARTTVLGRIAVHRLYATEALIDGLAEVRDAQAGCFRFGAYRGGSRLPRPYQSQALNGGEVLFGSRRFGAADYAQIALAAPRGVREGAESGSEIGAFSGLMGAPRLAGLRAKAAEVMPFGLQPFFIAET